MCSLISCWQKEPYRPDMSGEVLRQGQADIPEAEDADRFIAEFV